MLFQVYLPLSRLRAPVSCGNYAISRRTVINNVGQSPNGPTPSALKKPQPLNAKNLTRHASTQETRFSPPDSYALESTLGQRGLPRNSLGYEYRSTCIDRNCPDARTSPNPRDMYLLSPLPPLATLFTYATMLMSHLAFAGSCTLGSNVTGNARSLP